MISHKPIVEISTEDVLWWIFDYTNPTMDDDDRMLRIKDAIARLSNEDKIIWVLKMEDFDFRSIGYYIEKSHTYCIHRYHDILEQLKAL